MKFFFYSSAKNSFKQFAKILPEANTENWIKYKTQKDDSQLKASKNYKFSQYLQQLFHCNYSNTF